ncbi:MAG: hypothetical protein R2710_06080 [Acidimicrobiales bacterium]
MIAKTASVGLGNVGSVGNDVRPERVVGEAGPHLHCVVDDDVGDVWVTVSLPEPVTTTVEIDARATHAW